MRVENAGAIAQLVAAGVQRAYPVGGVPTSPVTPYCVVSVDSGALQNYRVGSRATSRFTRIAVQLFGRTFDEAAFVAEKSDLAFEDKPLTVTGLDTTPCRREIATNIQRDPDGGSLMYGLHTYTFTASPI